MSSSLTLPACFLPIATHYYGRKNLYRAKVETGGYLLASPDAPDVIRVATGPGDGSEHRENGVLFDRADVAEAAGHAGLVMVGDWHTHPGDASNASPADFHAWRVEADEAPRPAWFSVILVRDHDKNQWADMAAWRTVRRNGIYEQEQVETRPGLSRARELAADITWQVGRSAMLEPWTWKNDPGRLHDELAVLDVAVEASDLMHRHKLNERLERLGIDPPKVSRPREPQVSGEAILAGQMLRRHNTGTVIRVR